MEIKTSNSSGWTFIISGLIAIVYGLLAILPSNSKDIIKTMMLISGIVVIAIGVICFLVALSRHKKSLPWTMLLIESIAMIALGIVAIIWSKETVKVLIFIIGLWSVLMGAFMLLVILNKNFLVNRGFYVLSAILSICFGILLIINPFESAELFVKITGVIALLFGVIMVMFGFSIRRQIRDVELEIVDTPSEKSNSEENE
ncbi:MAG: DUF308 domain-containing protein [Bacteroidales bacterium]|nr:DUF308 domain-containing protein [Bacteroidales bacterium]